MTRRVSYIKIALLAAYVAVALALVSWCDHYKPYELRGVLVKVLPWFLAVNVLLLSAGLVLNVKIVGRRLAGIGRRQWALLSATALLALLLTAGVAPRVHRIFYDETIYLNIAQNLGFEMNAGVCNEGYNERGVYHCAVVEHNKQPYAYPFLLGLIFRVAGAGETAGFLFNNAVFVLTVLTAFLIAYLLLDNVRTALYSALVYALVPENAVWGNTTAVEPSAALFSGLAAAAALLCIKEKGPRPLFLLAVLLPFSMQFRMESALLAPVLALLFFLKDRDAVKTNGLYLAGLLAFALLGGHLLHLYAVSGESWGSSGGRMDYSFLTGNLKTNVLFYFNNARFPVIFAVLALAGLLLEKDLRRERIFLAAWFVTMWGVFLFFYAGSYGYGQDVRFSLVSFMPLAIAAGMGLERLGSFFSAGSALRLYRLASPAVVILAFLPFVPYVGTVGEEARQAREDHFYARLMAERLPKDSIVLTHNPNMFLVWGGNAAQASFLSSDSGALERFSGRFPGGVYFHYNFWCNVNDPFQREFCQRILTGYSHEKVMSWRIREYEYAMYRITGKGDGRFSALP